TDPIADMLTRLRNALAVRKDVVDIPHSKMKLALATILAEAGYLGNVVPAANKLSFRVTLRYNQKDGRSAIRSLERISKPGRRVYVPKDNIPVVLNGLGTPILSTSRGLMTGKEAKKVGVGGELICTVE
ncbi:30S ribosomal protein S8, partial [Candidatus Uhrbacteria bacterium]|nr:30S ribosomal protein S8 [Candidatus Uhrbacteria bacterium]